MIVKIRPIKDWRHIFLDTSVIIDLTINEDTLKDDAIKERVVFTKKLFSIIKDIRNREKKQAFYYVSSVTIGELITLDGRHPRQNVVTTLKSENLEVIDYSSEVATDLSQNIGKIIPNQEYKSLFKSLRNNIAAKAVNIGRNWIKDDFKICFCARSVKELDVILTADKNTFLPIGRRLGLPVLSTCGNDIPLDFFNEINIDYNFNFTLKQDRS